MILKKEKKNTMTREEAIFQKRKNQQSAKMKTL